MTFTPRFLIGLAATSMLGLAGVWFEEFIVISAWLMVCAFVLAAFDYLLSPGKVSVRVGRSFPKKMIVGHGNDVRIDVENRSGRLLHILVHDEPPHEFEMRDVSFPVTIPGGGYRSIVYEVSPPQRGTFEFNNITLVVTSPFFGLVRHHVVFDRRERAKVYPDFRKARHFEILTLRRRLHEWGVRSARYPGIGTEFESLREYTPDDDYRRISWTATARAAKPISSQWEAEKSQHVMIAIDRGRLMGATSLGQSKLDRAVEAALMLCHVSDRKGDKCGLMVFADAIDCFVMPGKGHVHLGLMLETLYDVQTAFVESDYAKALEYLEQKQKRRSLVVVFTEITDSKGSQIALRRMAGLARRHAVLCILLRDPFIEKTVCGEITNLRSAVKKSVAAELAGERDRAIQLLRVSGVHIVDVMPENLTSEVLNAYIRIKNNAAI